MKNEATASLALSQTEVVSTSWHTYPSPRALGHASVLSILQNEVVIEEKVDGSQMSFGVFDGELRIKSKNQQILLEQPPNLFKPAVETIVQLFAQGLLTEGWMYSGEAICSRKHNTICYERAPNGFFILFDVRTGHEVYLSRSAKEAEAARIGLEVVPCLFQGKVTSVDQLDALMKVPAYLGGDHPIEGIVIKDYTQFTAEGKVMMAKVVSAAFKEKHQKDWKGTNPTGKDILMQLVDVYRTEARWQKAVQHLQEEGKLEGTERDIGLLVKEVAQDILSDSEDEIKEALFKWAWKSLHRGVNNGLALWYKRLLLERATEELGKDKETTGQDT